MCRRTIAPCCQDCERPFNDLNDAGLCRHCAAVTAEALEATIAEQLQRAPAWFWRDVILHGQAYDVPEPMLTRFAAMTARDHRNQELRERVRAFAGPGPKKNCERCGVAYPTANMRSRFCSDACRAAARRQREAVAHAC